MDVVTPVITLVVNSLLVPIKEHLGFFVYSTDKARDMHSKAAELEGALHDMQTQRQSAETSRRVVPHRVPDWLEEVEELIKGRAGRIPPGGVGCFNLKTRYKVGKDSSDILKHINRLMKEKAEMVWPNEIVPLSAVPPVAQEEDRNQNRFKSRYDLLNKALGSLESTDISSQKMALCGMGGIGKTTMMEEMRNVASNRHMFDHIVKVVVGEKPNLAVVQQAVEEQTRTGEASTLTIEDNKAEQLKNRFEKMSEGGKKKILVILDDVWQEFDLKHIGLTSPLPAGFKLLLTSREESVCLQMDVQSSFIFRVEVLTDSEGKKLFRETIGGDLNNELLKKIGEDIVKRCGGLPIAIKTIASTLIGIKEKHKWEDALFRIRNQDFSTFRLRDQNNLVLINIFQFSYENLQNDEIKAIFLLSGLYPEDYNINIEELVRYGWGLQFFKNLPNIAQARIRVKSYVDDLIRSNLLNKSEEEGCVTMHDLVRDFVLISSSKVKQASISSNADEVSKQLRGEESYDRILLNCKGLLEFPEDFNHPNLTLLKLMYGDWRLKFPEDFYARMKKLEVLACTSMGQPKLPQSLTNLRALCLSWCRLEDVDISFLGDLINLEILTLACCGIRKLPRKLGNLKRLKLLDLSEHFAICIDDGVFQNMGKLEELYTGGSGIRFMDANCKPLKTLKLFALEFQFFKNEVRPVDVSFDKIERFKISVGCELEYFSLSFRNTLKLNTSIDDLLECKLNELFKKTEILHLVVNDMHHLERIVAPPSKYSFCMLNELYISHCTSLTCLFTVSMVEGLTELEILEVTFCPVLKSLVSGGDSEAGVITFPKLKRLIMWNLPELESLCDFVHVMKLPQLIKLRLDALSKFTSIFPGSNNNISAKEPLLKNEAVVPNLEDLLISNMENLKEIWPREITSSEEEEVNIGSLLKEIRVFCCNNLVNLFPWNPMRLLSNLKKLTVESCGSVEVLFDIDLGKAEQLCHHNSLKTIYVKRCESFKEVCRINDVESNDFGLLTSGFESVEDLRIIDCKRFTKIMVNSDLRATKNVHVYGESMNEMVLKNKQEQKTTTVSRKKILKVGDDISIFAFPSHHITPSFNHLRRITFDGVQGVKVMFEIESPSNSDQQQPLQLLPYLEEIYLEKMDMLSHVWKCNSWSEFLILHKTSFQNLTTICVDGCKSIKYLFSPLMVALFSNLTKVQISYCRMEQVVSNIDDEDAEITTPTFAHTTTGLFPRLDVLQLSYMSDLKQIGGSVGKDSANAACHGQHKLSPKEVVSWSLCQYTNEIRIYRCDALSSVIPSYAAGRTQKLQVLSIRYCSKMTDVFQTEEIHGNNTSTTLTIPRVTNIIVHQLPNLKKLEIEGCNSLKYVFTFSMLESLKKLETLAIEDCNGMEVIVREEYGDDTMTSSKELVFPNLKSVRLKSLTNVEGFFLGMNIDFQWPLLDDLKIYNCPQMMVFTSGWSIAPRLKHIYVELNKYNIEGHINFQTPSPNIDGIRSRPTSTDKKPWSFHNLTEYKLQCYDGFQKLIPSNELQHLQKLERIDAYLCDDVEEVFEVATDRTNDEPQTVIKIPKLREVKLERLQSLKYIWKSNQCRMLEFPNLTTLSISNCRSLEHVFTYSMVRYVAQLQDLRITLCENMKVIVKKEEEDCDANVSEIKFPCLKSLKLECLSSLEGFCLGKEEFTFESLDTVEIMNCPIIKVFTEGPSFTPKLTPIETSFGSFDVNAEEDVNAFIMEKNQEDIVLES